MLALTPHMRIFVAIDPIDFRCGMNRLAQMAKELFSEDPKSGVLFVFRNRRQSDAKLLVYDGAGFYLIHRRLSCGRFGFWPKTLLEQKEPGVMVEPSELTVLLRGGDPRGSIPQSWKRIEPHVFKAEAKSEPRNDRSRGSRRETAVRESDSSGCGFFAQDSFSCKDPTPAPT